MSYVLDVRRRRRPVLLCLAGLSGWGSPELKQQRGGKGSRFALGQIAHSPIWNGQIPRAG